MTTRVLSLSEFLLARINDDEAEARRAADGPFSITSTPYGETFGIVTAGGGDYLEEQWFAVDPARVLAECKAKRAIVEAAATEGVLADGKVDDPTARSFNAGAAFSSRNVIRALAAVYVDHPDFNPDWA